MAAAADTIAELTRDALRAAREELDAKTRAARAEVYRQMEEKRREALDKMQAEMAALGTDGTIRVLMHSLAFGSLKLYVAANAADEVDKAKMEMTLDVMANSLVYWTQDLMRRKMMRAGGRVFAMTSSGGTRVWPNYGPVSAAKAALESSVRYLANDLGPQGIRVNAISAGPIKTLASSAVGGISNMIKLHTERAPLRKAVDLDEVGDAALFLLSPMSRGITGEVIYVDGGYHILGTLAPIG